ncbi:MULTISPECIES: hypothetical protein [Haloarcula]|uniref:hypothetical protein n=1 Tax=Haloarcula TaxID=2237 RepID=UPI0023E80230|nr:hypothetical protein [Halomicroarcula sp. SHR3]
MAHQPERPKEYVCENCNNIVAGVADGEPPDRTYQPPRDCRACGNSEFVELDNYSSTPQAE